MTSGLTSELTAIAPYCSFPLGLPDDRLDFKRSYPYRSRTGDRFPS
ncbi:hypothetical protein JJD41_22395 [Oxynema sp. CENA135]|nr:hypothetical protein [Oxynema sp. CENA135]MBK4732593.1 hypothetical protein [Oxynema sp. CENA135]